MPPRKHDAKQPKRRLSAPKTYAQAGVDIAAGDALVEHLRAINPAIGGFAGLMPLPAGMRNPRLVASTDGVGTKLLVAQAAGRHETIGIDLVAMVVNDLIVCGARPLFFLDYFATGRLKSDEAKAVLSGIVEGCRLAGCPLIGGETAEMPGMYAPGHYDLAGFGVGVVEADDVLDGREARPGDLVLGLASDGLHSNGYSLARAALLGDAANDPRSIRAALRRRLSRGGPTMADELLRPTRIYVKTVLGLLAKFPIVAAAHITGGGIAGNLARVLPRGVRACVDLDAWRPQAIFEAIAERGPVAEDEMFRTFNMGLGFMMIVQPEAADAVIKAARRAGETCHVVGWLDKLPRKGDDPQVTLLRARA